MRKGIFKVTWLLFGLLLMMSLVLMNGSGEAATSAPKAMAAPKATPSYGGKLVIRHNLPASVGYPAKATPRDLDALNIVVDTLVSFDATGKPVPWLATGWKYSSDHKSLTMTLKQGVKFHDGTDFNAAAVKANLDSCRAAKRAEIASVSSVDVIDNYTVKLNLSKIDAFLLPNLAEFVGIMVSPAALAKGGDFARTNPVGTGPFKLVSYQANVGAKFEKWEGYWQKGKPYLDSVELVFIPNDTTAMAAFLKGEVNLLTTRDPTAPKNAKGAKITTQPTYYTLVPDSAHKDSPWSDIKVRQAVAHAIDSNTLQKSFGDFWPYNYQFVDKSSVYYDPTTKGYPYDVAKAKAILATSSYPKGFKTEIIYGPGGAQKEVCIAVQAMLAKIGIEVTLKPVSSAASTQLRADGWHNGLLGTAIGVYPEGEPGRKMLNWISKYAPIFSVVARSKEYDAIMDKILAEPDFNKRVVLNQQLLKQLIDGDSMVFPVFNNGFVYVKSANLNGDERGDTWLHWWTPQDAWYGK